MKPVRYAVAVVVVVALTLLGAKLVVAQSQPQQYYGGGGLIRGTVLGFDMWDQLQPIAWASVYANSGRFTFVAYSSSGGFYEMYVPAGTYNVTVVEPGYVAYSNSVSVSDGSSSTINVYLEQSRVPVPEFPSGMLPAIVILALCTALLAKRATRRKK